MDTDASYRESWLRLTVDQQREVCKRFGIVYTNSVDHALIAQVESAQQQEYDSLKVRTEHLRKTKGIFKLGNAKSKE